jgi:hypothetical protein
MQNINTLDRNSKFFALFIIITFKSKVTNSGAARVTGGLAPSFFVNMAVNVSRMHIALYSMI